MVEVLLTNRDLLRQALRERFPAGDGWRELRHTESGVRLRNGEGAVTVAHLEVADESDPNPLRAMEAALGRLAMVWQDPPGMKLVMVIPDRPAWREAAVHLTVRPGRVFGLEMLAVEERRRSRRVSTLDVWGTTWFGGSGLFELE
jgi:hypothetical protein